MASAEPRAHTLTEAVTAWLSRAHPAGGGPFPLQSPDLSQPCANGAPAKPVTGGGERSQNEAGVRSKRWNVGWCLLASPSVTPAFLPRRSTTRARRVAGGGSPSAARADFEGQRRRALRNWPK